MFFLKCAKSFGRFSSKNTSNAAKYVNICGHTRRKTRQDCAASAGADRDRIFSCTDKAVVHSEEGHLTRFVEQVGERDEGIGRVQVEDEHRRDERHSLHLQRQTHT